MNNRREESIVVVSNGHHWIIAQVLDDQCKQTLEAMGTKRDLSSPTEIDNKKMAREMKKELDTVEENLKEHVGSLTTKLGGFFCTK